MTDYQSILEGNPPGKLHWIPTLKTGKPRTSVPVKTPRRPFASRNDPWLVTEYHSVKFTHTQENNTDIFRWETPRGVITGRREHNHMVEYPLKTTDDIPLWQYIRENTLYRPAPDFSTTQLQPPRLMSFKWSPVQELLQFGTGIENFYYFMADAPEAMIALMDAMHRKNLEALNFGFQTCRTATVIQFNENTSSTLISPSFYREHSLPHVRDYADLAHRNGKRIVVHMCGLLKALLDSFPETGMDGIHAVTPPPIGDTHYTTIRELYGDKFVIIGRLNAQLWMGKPRVEILKILRSMIPDSLVHTPFSLWITSDEMPVSSTDIVNLNQALHAYNNDTLEEPDAIA